MKKLILLTATVSMLFMSCSKSGETIEIEKVVEKEVVVKKDVIDDYIKLAYTGGYSDDQLKQIRINLITKLKDFVNGSGSVYESHNFYYGRRHFNSTSSYTGNFLITVSIEKFQPKEVSTYIDGRTAFNLDSIKAPSGQQLSVVQTFFENQYIGTLSKQEVLNLK
ncbi:MULTISPECIES: hypothetical protein [unclassified Sphingobacterium]|uniref:hypothetical protein n=1 Tax=unclassified Sphingobacterium TaxID=2609468 RepID=UPI0025D93E4F|nr:MULTISPECIES: hypothetical protein [unclassified Sphingobacterium]